MEGEYVVERPSISTVKQIIFKTLVQPLFAVTSLESFNECDMYVFILLMLFIWEFGEIPFISFVQE